jgi:hypothetical protein
MKVRTPRRDLVPVGTVLELSASQWMYGDGPLTIRVERERPDLSRYYDHHVWIEGYRVDDAGIAVQWVQALVLVEVILEQVNAHKP